MRISLSLLVFVLSLMVSCKKKETCPVDLSSFISSLPSAQLLNKPVEANVEVAYIKSIFMIDGRGRAYFVPPDTLRIEVLAEWGELLFKIKGSGTNLTYEAPSMNVKGVLKDFPDIGIIATFLFGQPRIPDELLSGFTTVSCDKGLVTVESSAFFVSYDATTKELYSMWTRDGAWRLDVVERASKEEGGLPKLLFVKSEKSGNLKIAISSRKIIPELSGEQLLK